MPPSAPKTTEEKIGELEIKILARPTGEDVDQKIKTALGDWVKPWTKTVTGLSGTVNGLSATLTGIATQIAVLSVGLSLMKLDLPPLVDLKDYRAGKLDFMSERQERLYNRLGSSWSTAEQRTAARFHRVDVSIDAVNLKVVRAQRTADLALSRATTAGLDADSAVTTLNNLRGAAQMANRTLRSVQHSVNNLVDELR